MGYTLCGCCQLRSVLSVIIGEDKKSVALFEFIFKRDTRLRLAQCSLQEDTLTVRWQLCVSAALLLLITWLETINIQCEC